MREFIVTQKYENKQVFSVIKKEFPNVSTASLNKAFRLKDIKVNDARVAKDYVLHLNDTVKVYLNDSLLYSNVSSINYVYEDDNIIVAYKPKKIVSNYENEISDTKSFEELVQKDKGANVMICHRLDTNTEGLVIFAKNETAHNEILNGLKNGNIIKQYITLVYGKPLKNHDLLNHYILKDTTTGFSKVANKKLPNSKSCITEYNIIEYIKNLNCCILNVTLHTGRTHQIRAHMKYLNTPVIGDPKYSTNEINDKFRLYSQVLYASKYTFNFDNSSSLFYLNTTKIDITNLVIDKIYKLISK